MGDCKNRLYSMHLLFSCEQIEGLIEMNMEKYRHNINFWILRKNNVVSYKNMLE